MKDINDAIVAAYPKVRGILLALTRDPEEADDLIQEACARALERIEQFTPGTNIGAWILTIARNYRHTHRVHLDVCKRHARMVEAYHHRDLDGDQEAYVAAQEASRALKKLSPDAQQLLILAGMGYGYEEIAALFEVARGTVKSRVSRARVAFVDALDPTHTDVTLPRKESKHLAAELSPAE